jgi:hypothetical protein
MFEAYAVGVTLKLNNLVSPQLAILSQEFIKLDGLTIALGKSLKALGAESPALKAIAAGANQSNRALEKMSMSAAAAQRHVAALAATASGLGGMPALGGGGGRGGGGGGHGGNRAFGGYAHGGNIHMGPGGIGIGTVGIAAGGAFLPLAATAAGIYGMHAAYESAKDLNTERARFQLFGLSGAQNAEAFRFVDGMRVYGTTRAENMRNFREAQGVFRESGLGDGEALAGAKIAAPTLAKLDFLAKALGGESGAKMQTANMAMLRYIELSGGLKDAATFNSLADFGYRLNSSSGGTVDWQQLLAFKKTAGTAGYRLSEDALARLEPIMAEFSGGRAGTSLATAFGRLSGIVRVPNQVAHTLTDMGVWDKSKVEYNANGGIKRFNGNPLSSEANKLFQENPELFYERFIRPIYAKMKLGSEEVARENAAIFGRTGGAFFNAIERSMPTIQRSVEAMGKTLGILEAMNVAKGSLSGQETEFAAAWTDFKAASGTALLPFFSGLLKAGTAFFRGVVTDVPDTTDHRAAVRHNPMRNTSPYVAGTFNPGRGSTSAAVYLDGRRVGEIVTAHQERAASAPQAGGSGFDGRRALTPVTGVN